MHARSIVKSAAAVLFALAGLTAPVSAASSGTTSWTVYDYNPSGRALSPRIAQNSSPPTVSGNTVTFAFLSNTYTALVTTSDNSLTGDLSNMTLSDTVQVTGMGSGASFLYQDSVNCGTTASVRFYFTSPTGAGTTGFFTQFWWSNPMSVALTNNVGGTITASLDSTAGLSQWSDWNGHGANFSPDVTEAFIRATHNVQTVGLSFGGGCFFENGVTTSDGSGTFTSAFSES